MAQLFFDGAFLGDTDGSWAASVEAGLAYALQLGGDVVVVEGGNRATCTPDAARRARAAILEVQATWQRWLDSEPQWYRDWARVHGIELPAEPSTIVDVLTFVA